LSLVVRNLDPNDAALLSAMMATIGAIWAISLAAYQFIYGYFERAHRSEIDKVKMYIESGSKDDQTQKWLNIQRTFYARKLRKYMIVFGGYFLGGIATAISIIVSGATVAYDKPEWLWIAGVCFVVALGLLVSFLLFEVWSSFDEMRNEWNAIRN
jgi:hypothetical protein